MASRPAATRDGGLGVDEALAWARETWGVEGAAASRLPGDRDTNVLITTAAGERRVLKVAPTEASAEEIELEVAALTWLADRAAGLPLPRLVPTLGGEPIARTTDEGGQSRMLRMVTFLPGRLLAEVRPHTPELLEDVGRTLGVLDGAFEGFQPPALRHPDFPWDLRNAGRVMEEGIERLSGARRERLRAVLGLFREDVEAHLPSLPQAVVHGDANDHNVLVAPSDPGRPEPPGRVSGLIDFGDLMVAPRVVEPAVAAAYALLGKDDPLAAVRSLLVGYHGAHPLEESEVDALWPLVLARLGASVSISARRGSEHPDDPYLTVSEAPAWEALERLLSVHPRLAQAVLRAGVGLAPSRAGRSLVAWLEARGPADAAVLPAPFMARPRVLDLGVGSAELPSLDVTGDPTLFERHLDRLLEDEDATVGVGRWGEPRLLYRGPAFRHPSGDPLLARTVHIGVDLFAPAGTPVLAALAGRVKSVVDNRGEGDYGPTVILEHRPADGPVFWTLYGHLDRGTLERLEAGRSVAAGEPIARLGDTTENGGWPAHLHVQLIADLLDRDGDFPGVAPADEEAAWRSLSPDPTLLLALPRGTAAPPGSTVETLLGRRHGRVGGNLSVSYRRPLHVVRGWRQRLYDAAGRPWLDCVNNVAHVGHAHPRVVDAAARQKRVLETNTRYLHELLPLYAERLTETLPEPLSVCWLVSSGSEANELALRIAKAATGSEHVVVLDAAYHGNTGTLIDLSPYKHAAPHGAGPPPWVHVALLPDDYRGPYRRDDPDRGARYAAHVGEAVAAAVARSGRPPTFLHESLLSCGGQIELPPGYLEAAYRAVREAGGVVIADEVQTGLGRVGSHVWGFETQGVVPDIVTLGKPLGNGHPLGAVIATREVARAFAGGMEYFSTFGGNPASCAVGLAVLDVLRDEGLQQHAGRVGAELRAGLEALATRHPAIGDVRGRGFFLGVELVRDRVTGAPHPEAADYVVQRARERGILLSTDGPDHDVIKIKPPLPFDRADADRLVAVLDEVLAEDFVRNAEG